MGVAAALAVAGVAVAAGSAYVQYQGARSQAKLGQQAAAIKGEQIKTELATTALQARQQEAERQRRAELAQSAGIAGAAAAGLDYWQSPTAQTVDAENNRLVASDISSIRLLGGARQQQLLLQGRGNELESSAYKAMGSNAWIAPTLSLLGSAASAGSTVSGGMGGVDARNAALSQQAAALSASRAPR